jgi:CheY-like chemotaxis protein
MSVVRIRRDITEEKRLQAQVMTSDRMVSLGMLAAGVAHEINNPLMAVLGNLEILRDTLGEAALRPDVDDALSDALEASRRVEVIVRDLRLFSRAEEERTCAVDLVAVLKSTLRLAQTEVKHRARLVEEFHARPHVRGNESRLGQVFLNLIVNAAQAIPEGRADRNEIRIVTRLEGGRALVEISDTGCGIPEELAKQLFVPFITTKPVGVGTGLGLTICQRIVTGLGGRITFQSRVGHGTKFNVTLPVDESSVISPPKITPSLQPPTRRGRVGVIDDDVSLGSLIKRLLQRDHDVVSFTSASDALLHFEHDRGFDVVFCDLMMPVVTGVEFYQRLQNTAPELAERTIFMTGGAFTAQARSFLDRVPNRVMAKPFDIGALRALVNERVH